MSSGDGNDVSTTRRHGPAGRIVHRSGPHHALAMTYRPSTDHASDREPSESSSVPADPKKLHGVAPPVRLRQRRVPVAQGDELAAEALQVGEVGRALPVEPRRLVVLVVGVVVAALRPAALVAHPDHRRAVRHQHQAPRVAQLAPAQREDVGGRTVVALPAAVPRAVGPGPVGAAPAVGLVVLVVVGDEVVQREAVVAGEEVDALERRLDEVGAALHALHHRRHEAGLAAEEAAPDLPEAVVPVAPAGARPGPAQEVRRRRRPTARRSARRRARRPTP